MNPATTLTFFRLGKIRGWDTFFYTLSQFTGGVLGTLLAFFILGQTLAHRDVNFAITHPGMRGEFTAFVAEVSITFRLMTVILNLSNSQKVARYTGIAAGTLVVLFITFEAPLSGMSMNPARSFASDFVGMQWLGIWIYFAAPLIGMFSAAELFVRTRGLHSVICAKLNHSGNARCIFRCGYIWMDAKIGDWVVTPRYGKPVEIQALWFNALRTMESFAAAFRDTDRQRLYASLAQRSERSFNLQFWNEASGCLFDVVGPDGPDPSMRPNQIFAVSLYYSILDSVRAEQVVAAVQRELLTPYGLRTLAPGDPRYARQYQGDPRARDSSYHQGTVWPWLLGPFLEAFLRVHDHCDQALVQAREWMEPLHLRMSEYGLGQGE